MLSRKLIKIISVLVIILFIFSISIYFSQNNNPEKTEKNLFGLEKLEYARSDAEQVRGLSGRTNLPENSGLLFVYEKNVTPNFWMKGMNFALDIIWLDENWRVVGFEKNISPNTFPQTFSPDKPIRYVLEVNAGFVDKQQIKLGEKAYN